MSQREDAQPLQPLRSERRAVAPSLFNGRFQVHVAYAHGTPYWQLGTTCHEWTDQPEPWQEPTLRTLAAFRNVWWSLANEYDFMKE